MLLGEDESKLDSYLQKANENGPRAPFIGTTCFYVINYVTSNMAVISL